MKNLRSVGSTPSSVRSRFRPCKEGASCGLRRAMRGIWHRLRGSELAEGIGYLRHPSHGVRPLGVASAILVLALHSPGDAAQTVRSVESQRIIHALAGPILFIAGESTSSGEATIRSWSAEEDLGGFTNLVSGQLSAGDVSVGRRRIVVRTSTGYTLTCETTPATKRDEHSQSDSQRVVSYDGTAPVLTENSSTAVSLDVLDCTLTTPDSRVFTGVGSYSKTLERTRSNSPPAP